MTTLIKRFDLFKSSKEIKEKRGAAKKSYTAEDVFHICYGEDTDPELIGSFATLEEAKEAMAKVTLQHSGYYNAIYNGCYYGDVYCCYIEENTHRIDKEFDGDDIIETEGINAFKASPIELEEEDEEENDE